MVANAWLVQLSVVDFAEPLANAPKGPAPGVRLPARVCDMKFCLTSLILCCNCFLLVNTSLCSARNLLVADADGKKPSILNNSMTKRRCLLKVLRCDVDSLVSSAVRQVGEVGV